MNVKLKDTLTAKLRDVPRSYDDFVIAVVEMIEDLDNPDDAAHQMLDFIQNNPNENSGDVLKYLETLGEWESDFDENDYDEDDEFDE